MIATPLSRSERIIRWRWSTSRSVMADVGSSMMISRASVEIALAISTICIWATLRVFMTRRGSMSIDHLSKTALAFCLHLALVDELEPVERLAAEVDVLGDGHRGDRRQLLVDHRDPEAERRRTVRDADLLARPARCVPVSAR